MPRDSAGEAAPGEAAGHRSGLWSTPKPATSLTVRTLPAVAELTDVLPWPGLRLGSTVAAVGAASLLLTLLAGAMAGGSWAAVVGLPTLSPIAAAEYGIDLGCLAFIPHPGEQWPHVVATLVEGIDLVAVHTPAPVTERTARILQQRVRRNASVLLTTRPWPTSDLTIEATGHSWEGLGPGTGRLRSHTLTVTVQGRGAAARPRSTRLCLPPPSLAAPQRHSGASTAAPSTASRATAAPSTTVSTLPAATSSLPNDAPSIPPSVTVVA